MVRIVRCLKPLEDGWQHRAWAAFPPPAAAESAAPPPPALFEMEGVFEDEEEPLDSAAALSELHAASAARQAVAAIMQPAGAEDHAVYSAAAMAAQASGGSLEATAQMLARLGYTVRLHTSAGGSLYRLKHTYITATRTLPSGEPAEWVIDPSFAQAFAVACPTARYAHILTAVPTVLVAPLPRLVRALLLLGAELARCFEEQGLSLAPWRQVESLASKYDAASSVLVHSSDGPASHEAPAAAAAAAIMQLGVAVPSVAAAAAARKQQRDQQQLAKVQLRLARLGLLQEAPAPAASGGSSPASSGSASPVAGSPLSVLAGSQPQLKGSSASSRLEGFQPGPACADSQAAPWRPAYLQPEQQPASLLNFPVQRRSIAASVA